MEIDLNNPEPQAFLIKKMLIDDDFSPFLNGLVTSDMFIEYREHIDYLVDYFNTYEELPSIQLFMSKFPEFGPLEVEDGYDSYIDEIVGRYNLQRFTGFVDSFTSSIKNGKIDFAKFYSKSTQMFDEIMNYKNFHHVNIATNSEIRLEKRSDDDFIPTTLEEFDKHMIGLKRGEELISIFARTNVGKTWFQLLLATKLANQGYRVGFISPEMSAQVVGYRYDTLNKHFSNTMLMKGQFSEEYLEYVNNLHKSRENFFLYTVKDLNNKPTVSTFRNIIKKNSLDALMIDGLSYMINERGKYNQSTTEKLADISYDLMELSIKMGIPMLAAVQANRVEMNEKINTPSLYSIRDSDAIAHNSSRVISLGQNYEEGLFYVGIKKNRYGRMGQEIAYKVNWDIGEIDFHSESYEYNNVKEDKKERKNKKEEKQNNRKRVQRVVIEANNNDIDEEEGF